MRSQDSIIEQDPYRTSFGIGEGGLATLVIGIIFALVGLALLLFKY